MNEYGRVNMEETDTRYRNMPEEKKQELKQHQKIYREAKKSQSNNQ